ncbi:MAG: NAD(P)H-dependent glycerol-3-phosphate dehydrogenase [Candidatus Babeliales bacterium]|jgi:glycerol-3-phosphate dehydrogenase (NAD(P)+)
MKKVTIIGEGAWGTAVATLLATNGYEVLLWCYDKQVAKTIAKKQINERYLPGIKLPDAIKPETDLKKVLVGIDWIFEAIPVLFLREVLEKASRWISADQRWVVLSKGIEQKTLLLPTQIIDDVFHKKIEKAVFAGPSFAQEVATKQITAVTVASTSCIVGKELQQLLVNDYFRPYSSLDIIGVQVGAALKNVVTLGIGLLDGAGYNDNAKAFFMTRGFHEMVQLACAMGGKAETLYGLSGFGDLVLTSMGRLSKNLKVGNRLGKGEKLTSVLEKTGYTPEGVNSVRSVCQLMEQYALDLTICRGIYKVIFEEESVQTMLNELIKQPLSWECKE